MPGTRACGIAFLLILTLTNPSLSTTYDWSPVGPQGATPRRFAETPPSSEYEELAATMRMLFARTTGGEWIPISPDYGGFTTWTIDDVVVAPSDPERILLLQTGPYTGTKIHRTLDGGLSWDEVHLPIHSYEHYVYTLAIHPTRPDTLFAGSFAGLYRSADAGDSWEKIEGLAPYSPIPTDISIHPENPSVILMSGRGDDPGIYRSQDLGKTWERVFDSDQVGQLTLSPSDPLVVYALSLTPLVPGRLYRSMDEGVTWQLRSEDPRLSSSLVVDPSDAERLYILGMDDQGQRTLLLESADGGSSWIVNSTASEVGAGMLVSLGIAPGEEGGFPDLYLGSSYWGAFRSVDDGASWLPERFFAAYIGAIARDPLVDNRIYAGIAAGMTQSLANGRLWVSGDGGSSWSYSGESDDESHPVGRVWAIHPSVHLPDRVWVGTSYGLFLSEDAGLTMTHTASGLVRSIWEDPEDQLHLLVGTGPAPTFPPTPPKLLETTDGGSDWTEVETFDQAVLDIEVDKATGRIYCALGSVTIAGLGVPGAGGLHWWDEGTGWSEATDLSGLHVSGIILDPDSPGHIYVSTIGQGVMESADDGSSWAPMNEGLEDLNVHAIEALDLSGDVVDLVAGTWAGTYRWEEDRWEPLGNGMVTFPSGGDSVALQTTALAYNASTGVLYVGTSGRSAYSLVLNPPLGGAGGGSRPSIPRSLSLHQNHPNPFNPMTAIDYELPESIPVDGEVELRVFDVRGRRVRDLVCSSQGPGRYRVIWDGRDSGGAAMPSGIYLYTLRAGGMSLTRKMTLAR